MAVITISAAGGNWNATGTWVGGVVPLTTDSILGVTGSGPLTVNVASTIAGVDLTTYASTLIMNNQLDCNGTFLILGSGMTITAPLGSIGVLGMTDVTTARSNGCVVPFLWHDRNTNVRTTTLLDNWTVTNFLQYAGNSNWVVNGFQMNITNWTVSGAGGANIGRVNGTTIFNFNGATGSWNNAVSNTGGPVGNPIRINTAGNFAITGYMYLNPYGATGSGITYISGTVTGSKVLRIGTPSAVAGVASIYDVNLNGAGTWTSITIATNMTVNSTFNLQSNLNFTNLYIMPIPGGNNEVLPTQRTPVIFRGSGALKGGMIYSQSPGLSWPSDAATPSPLLSLQAVIQLTPGVTHSASYLNFIGGGSGPEFNRVLIRSATGGTQATLNLTGDQGVFYTNFTDINASGGNTIYTYGGTASNSNNIQTITSYVPTSASTFVN
jgi:hypothetical protein